MRPGGGGWAGGGPHGRGVCTVLSPHRMIYKCAMCDTVFTHKPLLSSHFDQHLLPQRVSVFKCPSCPLLFAQKRTMLEHLKVPGSAGGGGVLSRADLLRGSPRFWEVGAEEGRPGTARPPPPPLSFAQNTHQSGRSGEETAGKGAEGALMNPKAEPEEQAVSRGAVAPTVELSSSSSEEEEVPSSPEPPRPTRRPRRDLGAKGTKAGGGGPGGWTCGLCHSWFPERDEYVAHMKKEHGKVSEVGCGGGRGGGLRGPGPERPRPAVGPAPLSQAVKKFPCRLCERSFCSAPSLRRHVRVNHEGIKRVYPCR